MKCFNILKFCNLVLALLALTLACVFSRLEMDTSNSLLQVIGNLHPLVLHLPIGGLTFFIILDIVRKMQWAQLDRAALLVILLFTSLFANVSFFTGFLLSTQGGFAEDLLSDHLWCAAFYVVFLALCPFFTTGAAPSLKRTCILYFHVVAALISMVLTGHYGALMTHGNPLAPFLTEAEFKPVIIDKPIGERLAFKEVVHPILQAKCYACHGNGKTKGKLSLDSYEALLKGGKSGDTLIPGDIRKSLLISSIMLPIDHDEHMPPAKKVQLSEGEVNILKWWVSSGAVRDQTVGDIQAPPNILTAIEELVPEEIRQQREIDQLQKIVEQKQLAKQKKIALNEEIHSSVPSKLRPLLRFVSPHNASIHFSSVSLQHEFKDEDFAALSPFLPYFTSVDLSHSSISSPTVTALSSCHNLHSLRLSDTSVTSDDVARLSKLSKLQSLSLHSTSIDALALEHLGSIKSLRKLYLWNNEIAAADIEQFKSAHPNINVVH